MGYSLAFWPDPPVLKCVYQCMHMFYHLAVFCFEKLFKLEILKLNILPIWFNFQRIIQIALYLVWWAINFAREDITIDNFLVYNLFCSLKIWTLVYYLDLCKSWLATQASSRSIDIFAKPKQKWHNWSTLASFWDFQRCSILGTRPIRPSFNRNVNSWI